MKLLVEPEEAILDLPALDLQVRTWAQFADGSRKDVSGLAVFESTNPKVDVSRSGLVKQPVPGEGKVHGEETTIVVRYLNLQSTSLLAYVPSRPSYQWSKPHSQNYVDDLVFARLKKLRVNPSDLCSDHEFLAVPTSICSVSCRQPVRLGNSWATNMQTGERG